MLLLLFFVWKKKDFYTYSLITNDLHSLDCFSLATMILFAYRLRNKLAPFHVTYRSMRRRVWIRPSRAESTDRRRSVIFVQLLIA